MDTLDLSQLRLYKEKEKKHDLDGRDGLNNMGPKIDYRSEEIFCSPNQSLIESDWISNPAIGLPHGGPQPLNLQNMKPCTSYCCFEFCFIS